MSQTQKAEEGVTLLALSGINYPTSPREYLMGLFREAAEREKPAFVILAGGSVDGTTLEKEFPKYARFAFAEKVAEWAEKKRELDKVAGILIIDSSETRFMEIIKKQSIAIKSRFPVLRWVAGF